MFLWARLSRYYQFPGMKSPLKKRRKGTVVGKCLLMVEVWRPCFEAGLASKSCEIDFFIIQTGVKLMSYIHMFSMFSGQSLHNRILTRGTSDLGYGIRSAFFKSGAFWLKAQSLTPLEPQNCKVWRIANNIQGYVLFGNVFLSEYDNSTILNHEHAEM